MRVWRMAVMGIAGVSVAGASSVGVSRPAGTPGGAGRSGRLAVETLYAGERAEQVEDGLVVLGDVAADGTDRGVRVSEHWGVWRGLLVPGAGWNVLVFTISGALRNLTGGEFTYVKLEYELLDGGGAVVHRDFGYNTRAEALRELDYESGRKSLSEMGIAKIPGGAEEAFRFIFFRSDVPEFARYRIRV